MTKEELAFLESLSVRIENGMTYEHAMNLLAGEWFKADPASARAVGRRVADTTPESEIELLFAACVDGQGEPAIKVSMGREVMVVSLFRARGLVNEIFASCEEAETEVYLRTFFKRTRDQVLAEKIIVSLIPYLKKVRQESVNRWANLLLETMKGTLVAS